jgi:hypothetical protein
VCLNSDNRTANRRMRTSMFLLGSIPFFLFFVDHQTRNNKVLIYGPYRCEHIYHRSPRHLQEVSVKLFPSLPFSITPLSICISEKGDLHPYSTCTLGIVCRYLLVCSRPRVQPNAPDPPVDVGAFDCTDCRGSARVNFTSHPLLLRFFFFFFF